MRAEGGDECVWFGERGPDTGMAPQNGFCPICLANDLLRPEAGSHGWRPFDQEDPSPELRA